MLKLYFTCFVALYATDALSYIDPNTTHTVISSLGGVLAAIGAAFVFLGTFLRVYFEKFRSFCQKLFNFRRTQGNVPLFILMSVASLALWYGIHLLQKDGSTMQAKVGGFSSNAKKRMIILGIDGMDPKLTKDLMDQGKLPNFKRLAETGDFKNLMTVNPVQSPVVWATMATGFGPGTHGVADFITRRENGYVPELSLTRRNSNSLFRRPSDMFAPPVSPKLFFWEKLESNGVSSKVIRWPLTFPAAGEAKILSGLGTPDLLGGMGTYTIFTTDPSRFPEDIKGPIVKLDFQGQAARAQIAGPKKSGLTGVKEAFVNMVVRKTHEEKKVGIEIEGKSWILREGELSPWIPLEFSIGFGNTVSGIAQFLVLSTENGVHIHMSPIQIDPVNPAYPIATEHYGKELAAEMGHFHTLGMGEDTNALSDEVINEEQFVMMCDSIMDEAEAIFFRELKMDNAKFFSFVFETLDRVQHMFWRFRDSKHSLYDAELAQKYGSVIEDFYQRMDRILGRLMEEVNLEETDLLVVSDHGFTSYRRNFHVNAWLIEQGYMVLKDGHRESNGLFQNVDWSKTKAFAMGFSQIFINMKDRDEKGIVPKEEVAGLKEEIAAKLTQAMDPSEQQPAVKRVYNAKDVYGLEPEFGPDLLVGMRPGYRFSWQTAVGGTPGFTFDDNDKRWSGDHCVDPEHVPGVIFSNRPLSLEHPSVIDVAPTVLEHFGVERTEGMLGQNLFGAGSRHASKSL